MRDRITLPSDLRQLSRRLAAHVAPPEIESDGGIEVHEEECGTVTVQRMYKVRCDCGHSWFELVLPKFVTCPSCHKLSFAREQA